MGTGLSLSTGKERVFLSLTSLGIANKHFVLNGMGMSILAKA